jgi:PHD/YefM family antitoxin component YafN of YafNO toxin-antitoxin module
MTESSIPISKLNKNGSRAVAMARRSGRLAITDRGRTVAFMLSTSMVESLLDTVEVLSDEEAMRWVRKYKAGKVKMRNAGVLDG